MTFTPGNTPLRQKWPTNWSLRFAAFSGIWAIGIGLVVLAGWAVDNSFLKQVIPISSKMAGITAVCFVAAGAMLRSASRSVRSGQWTATALWFQRVCALWIAGVGGLKLLQYAFGLDVGIDRLIFPEAPGASNPTQMAIPTATDFLILGIAFLLPFRYRWANKGLALAAGLLAWLGLSEYFYGGAPLIPGIQMAVHTAVTFLVLSFGTLCLRVDGGLIQLLGTESSGGVLARRLIPATLIVPIAAGGLLLQGLRKGGYGVEGAIALMTLLSVIIFGGLVWATAARLDRSELARDSADQKQRAQLERLNLLQQITQSIRERQDLASIYQTVLGRLEDALPVEFACFCRYEPAGQCVTVSAVGRRSSVIATATGMHVDSQIDIDGNGLTRCVSGELVYEPDVTSVAYPFPSRIASGGLRALVITPLLVEDQTVGVLVVARSQSGSFSSVECEFLKQLGEHVALAARQAELHASLQQAYDDLRQTQEAAMQQERLRALGQMASGIAHDINNAISPIALYTGMVLERETNLSQRTRDCLEITQRAIEDVAHTVGRMREFYRRPDNSVEFSAVDLNLMIGQVLDLTRARWSDMPQQRGAVIEVLTELEPTLSAVPGVESEIREALTNLIFNAVDAMPDGGVLRLRTELRGQHVHLEVQDTGAGMNEDTRQRCLEPFFTTKGERGTGLGLAMVYGSMRRHGADIDILTAPGRGTTIRLMFPAATAPPAASVSGAGEVTGPLRILVVDDDPLLLRSLQDTLSADGHDVTTAEGGEAAMAAIRTSADNRSPYLVVITDLGMPKVDGRKVASFVKEASPSTFVVMLTGWGQRLATEGEVPPSVDIVLSKPPKLADLREALRRSNA